MHICKKKPIKVNRNGYSQYIPYGLMTAVWKAPMRVQRQGALQVLSAYRTVSEPAVMVIAGMIPAALLAKERKTTYTREREDSRA